MRDIFEAQSRCPNGMTAARLLGELSTRGIDFIRQGGYQAANFIAADAEQVGIALRACHACDHAGYICPIPQAQTADQHAPPEFECGLTDNARKAISELAAYYNNPDTQIPGADHLAPAQPPGAYLKFETKRQ